MSNQGCSKTCGNGVRTITRDRDPPLGTNLHDGIPCDGEEEATMPCNLLDEAEATAAKQGKQIEMLRLCASDCSTELPANYGPEMACTELLPTACSDGLYCTFLEINFESMLKMKVFSFSIKEMDR